MKLLTAGHSLLLTIVLYVVEGAFLVVSGSAAELTITNQSFENPALSDGAVVFSVPGWTWEGTAVIQNLNDSYFTGTSQGSPNNPINGANAAAVNNGGKLIYSDTNWTIKADSIYQLTFLAGYRIGVPFGAGSVSFWAGTNLLAERFPTPAENTFAPFSLSYTSPPSGSAIGSPLRIELKAQGASSQAWFDNFHLFVTDSICTPHKATATAQLVNGIFVGATITDAGCGYTNAPLVIIQGGGGTGATATALVTNGQVAAIRVDSGGCCYTNVPQIVIASPPFVPTVQIRVSRIIVTQNVQLGHKYVLESSDDLVTWTPTGVSFTAVSESVESEFEVNVVGKYFRLREVP